MRKLLKSYGEWTDWRNYRLKGTQIGYVDEAGNATHLGNSKLEVKVVRRTSSCISCHAAVRADAQGTVACDLGFINDDSPHESPNGAPDEYDPHTGLSQKSGGPPMGPMGFVWSVVNAHAENGEQSCNLPHPIE